MKPTDLFVRRPILALVVTLAIVAAGFQALRTLTVRQYPKLDSATVTVRTVYVGASAEVVRGFVTTPLERAIAAAEGIDYLESQSTPGVSVVSARLKLHANATAALADVSARVNQVRADLPAEAQIPSVVVEPSDGQVAGMYLSFTSSILEQNQVTDYLIRVVQPRLSALAGVQRADILGGRAFALRAWLKPERMAALGVSPSQLRQALAANHTISAVGQTKGEMVQVNLTADTDLKTVEGFRKLVVREHGSALVRLEDVADVVLGAESYEQDVRQSGEKAIFMGVWVAPNESALEVLGRVRAAVGELQGELPAGMTASVAFDSSRYIDRAIDEVGKTLLETILIVAVVVFLFLGSARAALVPLVAIPVSLIGAAVVMQLLGFSLNLLTLLAIVLAVGLVVDDAIVVVENVERNVRGGRSPLEAALSGARELLGPIVAMTITLAAVVAPIGLQGGITGALFREFAFTLAGAVLVSGVVALTLSPIMSARLVDARRERPALARASDRAFAAISRGYERALGAVLTVRPAVYAAWLVLSLSVVPMYLLSPKELAPAEDQGVIHTVLDVPANASLEQVTAGALEVGAAMASEPEFDHSFQITYASGGFGGMILAPWEERKRSVFPVHASLSAKVKGVTAVRAPVFLPSALPNPGTFPVEVVIASNASHVEMLRFAEEIAQAAAKSGEFAFPPKVDLRVDQGSTNIALDRDKIASMGLSMQQVGGDLAVMLGGNFVSRFNYDGRSYKVIPQIERASRLTPAQLADVHVTGPAGRLIPLSAVATFEDEVEARALNRFQQLNAIKITGVPTRGLDSALRVVEAKAKEVLPAGYRVEHTGESRQLRQEAGKFVPSIALALLVVFLVLAVQFNSLRDPLVILLGSVPLALFGALVFTFLKFSGPPGVRFALTEGWTTTLNIYSQVGLVTLMGLVAKNAILIVEFANARQDAGLPKLVAVRHAAVARLRPILMTTLATVAGHLPLVFVSGAGAVARNSIGIVLVFGMSIGTLFTLFVVPCIYVLFAKQRQLVRARDEGRVVALRAA